MNGECFGTVTFVPKIYIPSDPINPAAIPGCATLVLTVKLICHHAAYQFC